jgi:hypothetical protein
VENLVYSYYVYSGKSGLFILFFYLISWEVLILDSSGKSHWKIRIHNLKEYEVNMDLADERRMNEHQGIIDLNGAPFYVLILSDGNVLSCLQCDKMRVDTPHIKIYHDEEVIGVWYKEYVKRLYVTDTGVELTLNKD